MAALLRRARADRGQPHGRRQFPSRRRSPYATRWRCGSAWTTPTRGSCGPTRRGSRASPIPVARGSSPGRASSSRGPPSSPPPSSLARRSRRRRTPTTGNPAFDPTGPPCAAGAPGRRFAGRAGAIPPRRHEPSRGSIARPGESIRPGIGLKAGDRWIRLALFFEQFGERWRGAGCVIRMNEVDAVIAALTELRDAAS